jgi:hypothetical protein
MSGEIIYTSIPAIIDSCTTLDARIAMLNLILNAMETTLLTAASTGKFETYRLDTGQTKNEVIYRSVAELQSSYEKLLKTQQLLMSRRDISTQGRAHRLVSNKFFKG